MPHLTHYNKKLLVAGCDEAGRGCLAGPVYAAAVILPPHYKSNVLNDSKLLSEKKRIFLEKEIKEVAIAFAVSSCTPSKIDEINILNASLLAMKKAIKKLHLLPDHLLIDGNRFSPIRGYSHSCMIKGDARFYSIAAASILAKNHRDRYMKRLARKYPLYGWEKNMGYPTLEHRTIIKELGHCPAHRLSFSLYGKGNQLKFF